MRLKKQEILKILKNYPSKHFKIVNSNITSLISQCEVFLVTDISTTVLDASIMNKPIILIRTLNYSHDNSLFKHLNTIDIDQIKNTINSSLKDSDFKKSLRIQSETFLFNYSVNSNKSSKILIDYLSRS